MDLLRVDKWLWAARFFKTRTLAAQACELGRVEWNGQRAKASREIRSGDLLQVKTPSGDFQIEVLAITANRGPAAFAQTLYRETDESRTAREALREQRRMQGAPGPAKKPDKRARRLIRALGDIDAF
jgi:ribosome-associated heat shock protein Hsp15